MSTISSGSTPFPRLASTPTAMGASPSAQAQSLSFAHSGGPSSTDGVHLRFQGASSSEPTAPTANPQGKVESIPRSLWNAFVDHVKETPLRITSYFSKDNLQAGWEEMKGSFKKLGQEKSLFTKVMAYTMLLLDLVLGVATFGLTLALGLVEPVLFSFDPLNAFANGVHNEARAKRDTEKAAKIKIQDESQGGKTGASA